MPQTNDIIQGYIPHIQYSKKCNRAANLQPGVGTMKLMHALFSVTRTFFPWVESYVFEDMSRVRCSKGNYMNLAVYSLAFHGKTWYDSKFQARKRNPLAQDLFTQGKQSLQQAKRIYWNDLKPVIPVALHETLQPLYENATTYADFFHAVYNIVKADRRKSCEFLRPWLERALEFILDDGNIYSGKWIMDVPPMTNITVFVYSPLTLEPEYMNYPESEDEEATSGDYSSRGGGCLLSIHDV